MNYKFCCIFFCTKKKRRRNTGIFDTNEYFLFFQKTHFTYSTYLRIFFFFHFTKIVTIIYILFLPSNFSPPNKNEQGHEMILRFYFSLPQCLCTIFSLFFSNRATRCNVSQRSQFRRKNEQRILSVDASEIPGKISHTALNVSRSPRVRQRETATLHRPTFLSEKRSDHSRPKIELPFSRLSFFRINSFVLFDRSIRKNERREK